MDPLSIGITLGSSIIGGILGSSAEAEKERKVQEQIRRAQALARQGLISKEQLASRLRDIDRLFNKRLISTLSSTAFGGRRFANANVAGASVAGQLGAQSEASKIQYQGAVEDRNAQIFQYMAGLEAGAPVFSPLEGGVTGALGGAQVGLALSGIVNRNKPTIPTGDIPVPTADYASQYNIVDYFKGYQESPMNLAVKTEDIKNLNFSPLNSWKYF